MRLDILFALICLSAPLVGESQDMYTLSGNVTDKSNHKIASGKVFLMDGDDSSLVKTSAITNGSFIMDTTKQGEYWVRVSAFGFLDKTVRVTVNESKTITIVMEKETVSVLHPDQEYRVCRAGPETAFPGDRISKRIFPARKPGRVNNSSAYKNG